MDFLEKQCKEKKIALLAMIGGFVPLVIMLLIGVMKVYSLGILYVIAFYVANAVFVWVGVISAYAVVKKSKTPHMITLLILAIASFVFLMQYKGLIDLLSGSLSGVMSYALSYYGTALAGSTFWLSCIVWMGLLGYGAMVYTNKLSLGIDSETYVEEIDVEKLKQNASEVGKKASQNIKQTRSKLKDYLGTKKGKRNVSIVGVIVIILASVTIYLTYFNKTVVDVTSNLKVTFNGDNGKGYVEIDSNEIEYDKNDLNMYYFISGLSYEYSPKSGKLSNGDEVTIHAIYSKTKAEELKIDVKNASKKFKVEGLVERYDSASEVDKKIASTLKEEAADKIKDVEKKLTDLTEIKTEYVASYFGKVEDDYGDDYYLAVYKVMGKEKQYFTKEVKDVIYYYTVRLSGIDSNYEGNKSLRYDKLKTDDYKAVSEENQIEEGLNNLYLGIDKYTKFE